MREGGNGDIMIIESKVGDIIRVTEETIAVTNMQEGVVKIKQLLHVLEGRLESFDVEGTLDRILRKAG